MMFNMIIVIVLQWHYLVKKGNSNKTYWIITDAKYEESGDPMFDRGDL